jgi:hypothetical protein
VSENVPYTCLYETSPRAPTKKNVAESETDSCSILSKDAGQDTKQSGRRTRTHQKREKSVSKCARLHLVIVSV